MALLPVTEIFSSIQGEGPYVGVRQIFLRLPQCNLTCPYCDTPTESLPSLRLERMPGSQVFDFVDNPISVEALFALLQAYDFTGYHSLSVTGGEPLLWAAELADLLPWVKGEGLRVYLETNGTLPEPLSRVLPWVDLISMDIKLPFGGQTFWAKHEEFLRRSLDKEVFVKIVVHKENTFGDLEKARDLIARVDPTITTVLQPLTEKNGLIAPEPSQVLMWQAYFLDKLKNVRVIPQTHVFLGVC